LNTGKIFRDYSDGGVLAESTVDCPYCYSEKSLTVCAGNDGSGNISANSWHCGACENTGSVVGTHSEAEFETDDAHDDHLFLPMITILSNK